MYHCNEIHNFALGHDVILNKIELNWIRSWLWSNLFHDTCAVELGLITAGFSNIWWVNMGVLVDLDMSRWVGDPKTASRGTFLEWSRFRYTSEPSLLFVSRSSLALFTVFSARPLLWGYSGLLVMWQMCNVGEYGWCELSTVITYEDLRTSMDCKAFLQLLDCLCLMFYQHYMQLI